MSGTIVFVAGGPDREEVLADTWGHLAPVPARVYPGVVLFARSEWDEVVMLRADFPNLPDSPWFYDDLLDMIADQPADEAGLYVWRGSYRRTKQGLGRFTGRAAVTDLADLTGP